MVFGEEGELGRVGIAYPPFPFPFPFLPTPLTPVREFELELDVIFEPKVEKGIDDVSCV